MTADCLATAPLPPLSRHRNCHVLTHTRAQARARCISARTFPSPHLPTPTLDLASAPEAVIRGTAQNLLNSREHSPTRTPMHLPSALYVAVGGHLHNQPDNTTLTYKHTKAQEPRHWHHGVTTGTSWLVGCPSTGQTPTSKACSTTRTIDCQPMQKKHLQTCQTYHPAHKKQHGSPLTSREAPRPLSSNSGSWHQT
jgi:hypothetical protein